jgi:hypothetical protein
LRLVQIGVKANRQALKPTDRLDQIVSYGAFRERLMKLRQAGLLNPNILGGVFFALLPPG